MLMSKCPETDRINLQSIKPKAYQRDLTSFFIDRACVIAVSNMCKVTHLKLILVIAVCVREMTELLRHLEAVAYVLW